MEGSLKDASADVGLGCTLSRNPLCWSTLWSLRVRVQQYVKRNKHPVEAYASSTTKFDALADGANMTRQT